MDSALSSSSAASEVSSTSPQAEHLIVLVQRSEDWKPADVADIPPDVEVHYLASDTSAAAFTRLFNERELRQSSGRWAIYLANASAVIVGRPEGWKPAAATDLPPNVEVHKQPSADLAALFADNFNRLEIETAGSGYWAVVARSTSAECSRVEGDNFDVIDEHGDDDDDDRDTPDDFDRMFPGLPIVVVAADGTEHTELLPDPRAAFARQSARYGATVKEAAAVKLRTTAVDPPGATNSTGSDPGLMRLAAMGSVPMKGGA